MYEPEYLPTSIWGPLEAYKNRILQGTEAQSMGKYPKHDHFHFMSNALHIPPNGAEL